MQLFCQKIDVPQVDSKFHDCADRPEQRANKQRAQHLEACVGTGFHPVPETCFYSLKGRLQPTRKIF